MRPENEMTLAEWKRLSKKKPRKYRNVPTVVDGQRFDSKAEARHYASLVALRDDGQLKTVLRQVPFRLPGSVIYRADFLVHCNDGRLVVHEVKGSWTQPARIKWKQAKELYPNVTFVEVQA